MSSLYIYSIAMILWTFFFSIFIYFIQKYETKLNTIQSTYIQSFNLFTKKCWLFKQNYKNYLLLIVYFSEYQLLCLWWLIYYYYTVYYNINLLKAFLFILLIVLSSTYLSLFERHVVAIIQQRVGPTTTGLGLLQPLADAFKLLTKEPTRPYKSNLFLFRFAPIYTFSIALLIWTILPLSSTYIYANVKYSVLFLLGLFAINSFGIVIGAWSSHNKYAIFSAIRTIALTNSYGISISLAFLYPCFLAQTYNFIDIITIQSYTVWFIIPGLPISLLFWVILITELKKIPFDVTESEAELGSGYLVEYSGMGFALFILTEYCYLLIICFLFSCCFLGGWLAPIALLNFMPDIFWLSLKIFICLFVYFLARSTLPNLRFDYIMSIHWKFLFPLLFILFVLQVIIIIGIL